VRIVGLEEGVFPSRHALAEGRLEEERRLAYVAMTRARSELVLSWARTRRGDEQARSRFVAEAAPDVAPAGSPGGKAALEPLVRPSPKLAQQEAADSKRQSWRPSE
jgi:superfamily I DNA/RNA helicase